MATMMQLYLGWHLAWKDNLVRFRSRVVLVFVVVMPLFMVLVQGLGLQGLNHPSVHALVSAADRTTEGGQGSTGFSSFSQAVAGNAVLFILLNSLITSATSLERERRRYTLDRLLISPMTRSAIVFGKALGVYLLGVLQAVVLFGFGAIVGVHLGDLLGVALVTLVFILVGCTLGLMIGVLIRQPDTVQMVCSPVGMFMAALGGGLYPIELAPPWMRSLALWFPTGWAMQAYHKLMWDDQSWLAVLPNVAVLAAFAAGFLLLGVLFLRWE
jgi:ABC-2 type transport system permease protein